MFCKFMEGKRIAFTTLVNLSTLNPIKHEFSKEKLITFIPTNRFM